jgi:hypothetical protein
VNVEVMDAEAVNDELTAASRLLPFAFIIHHTPASLFD